jgi:phage shock protein A
MTDPPYDDARAAFTDADTRFQQSLSSAFAAHTQCVGAFFAMVERVERREAALQESVAELRHLVLEQGQQITALRLQVAEQGRQISELRARLNGDTP